MRVLFRRLRYVLLGRDDDLREEMEVHRAMRQAQLEQDGMTPAEAAAASSRAMGNVALAREDARAIWLWPWLDSVRQDARYALRAISRQPGFSVVAVGTLGLAIGLNTAVFDIYSALTLRPWRAADPQRLVTIYSLSDRDLRARAGGGPGGFSRAEMDYFAEHSTTLSGFFLMRSGGGDRTIGDGDVPASWVSGAYFEVLGIDMAAGRAFTPAEDRLESPAAVAVVSYGYWQRQFGGDPAVAGRIVQLEDIPFTIVGVAPAAFTGTSTERVDIWMPLASARLLRPDDRWVANVAARPESCCLSLAGRLAPGATREEALAELSLLDRQFREGRDPDAGRLRIAGTTGSGSSAFPPVFAGVMLVLLLASANVANLLLARASARRREIGVRLSLGASRARVVRQLLTESLILAVLALATGLLVAAWLSAGIVGFMFGATSLRFQTDAGVLAYALAISGLSCVVAGLGPALHGTRTSIGNALKEVMAVPDSRVSLRSAFLSMQVAVSVVLLASAGLLIHALYEASRRDLGFPASDVAVVSFEAPARGYDAQRIRALARQLAETMGALPAPVALASTEPLGSGNIKGGFRVPGSADELFNSVFEVSPAYFDLLGLTAIAGRRLEASDDNRNVIVINETMARRHWTVSQAVGQRILVDPATGGWNTPGELEIVGVVRDIRQTSLEGPAESIIYQPLSGRALPRVLVRDPGGTALAAIRAAAEKVDPRLRVRTRGLADNVDVHLTPTRTGALMASVLGALSLVLATVGMLGVFSYWVQQRTREIGIRVALGARSSQVVRLVLGSSARSIAAGMAVGAIGAGVASRFLGSLLYGINPIDPVTFVAVLCLLGAAGAAATYWPARRAVRVDPVIALRSE